ncbi:MAG TPA: putative PEP-binding protein [Candidatus Limnocylindrales bacterium]|nr:putative PEP-binding protein [Candidatus Limnocylindrales bacterium]
MTEASRAFERWVSLVGEAPTPILDRFGGVGLVRGEFFMRRVLRSVLHDDVRKSIAAYLDSLCAAMNGREVWYRTADLWSEEAAVLDGTQYLVAEGNPIVGVRGVRRSLAAPDEFVAECQVLAEVGARHGNLRVLFPFVADEHEFARASEIARDSGVMAPIGSMVEVPSAALRAGAIADAGASLLLVGMNDLSCLTCGRERSPGFADKLHPAVQNLISATVLSASERSIRCGVAGSLSTEVIAMAQACGADFATVHYSQARQLFWPEEQTWPDEGLEFEVKVRTKEAIRRRAQNASGNG